MFAPHRAADRFFNPWAPFPHTARALLRFWIRSIPRQRLGVGRESALVPRALQPGPAASSRVTFVGHATFVIQHAEHVLLTDPHWGPRAKVRRRRTPPGVALDSVPHDACALISHNHYDHLDRYTVGRLSRETRWFVPLGLASWFRSRGHPHVIELDWWDEVAYGPWRFTCLPAQHWSMRLLQRRNETLWCSWLVRTTDRTFYFGGDSGYFHGFREFGRRFAPIDVALLPIGTYEPRWFLSYQHMDPAEAYQAFLDLRARWMIPMHWGTFQLAWDAFDEAPDALQRGVAARGGDAGAVRTLAVGQSWRVG